MLDTPLGYILSLEGADSIVSMEHLEVMFERGLRAIGPVHYGPGTYGYGTGSSGGIGKKGKILLQKIQDLKLILDVTHLGKFSEAIIKPSEWVIANFESASKSACFKSLICS